MAANSAVRRTGGPRVFNCSSARVYGESETATTRLFGTLTDPVWSSMPVLFYSFVQADPFDHRIVPGCCRLPV